jgi:predicted phage tail protein
MQTITASASDNVAIQKVQFWAGSTYLGNDTSAPYTRSWDTTGVANGVYSLKARAIDTAGNFADKNITVVVTNGDVTAPSVALTAPENGATVSGMVSITAMATDATAVQKVQFWAGSTYLGFDSSAPYTRSWDTSALPDGSYTLRARAIDWSGNSADHTIVVSIGAADETPPTVSFLSPDDLDVVSGTITIDADASDDVGISKVRVWVDSTYMGYDASAPYSWSWDTTAFANGTHTIRVQAVDLSGNLSANVTITVTVSN